MNQQVSPKILQISPFSITVEDGVLVVSLASVRRSVTARPIRLHHSLQRLLICFYPQFLAAVYGRCEVQLTRNEAADWGSRRRRHAAVTSPTDTRFNAPFDPPPGAEGGKCEIPRLCLEKRHQQSHLQTFPTAPSCHWERRGGYRAG